jgi:hypothetical protein
MTVRPPRPPPRPFKILGLLVIGLVVAGALASPGTAPRERSYR